MAWCGAEALYRSPQQLTQLRGGDLDGGRGHIPAVDRLDLDQKHVVATCGMDPMDRALEAARAPRDLHVASQRGRFGQVGGLRAGLLDPGVNVAAERREHLIQQALDMHREQGLYVRACLDDVEAGLAPSQQQAVRLHRAGKVDRLGVQFLVVGSRQFHLLAVDAAGLLVASDSDTCARAQTSRGTWRRCPARCRSAAGAASSGGAA